MIAHQSPQAPIDQLSPKQNALASRVFTETMGELAKCRVNHGNLEDIADEFASALRVGLREINDVSGLTNEQVAKLEQAFALPADTNANYPICVLSATSSGGPANHPGLTAAQANGYLQKAAAKLEETGDIARFINDVFSCGWPDVEVSYRQYGPSQYGPSRTRIHAATLQIRPLDHENQRRQGDSSAQPAR